MPSFPSVRMASHGFSQKGNGRTQAISQIPATSYFSIGRATVPVTTSTDDNAADGKIGSAVLLIMSRTSH